MATPIRGYYLKNILSKEQFQLLESIFTTQPSTSTKSNMVSDSIKDTQLDLFNQTPLTFGGKSINEQLEIMNTPEFKSFFAEETIKNPNLDASEALDYYIKCKGL
jgi:hypothetical protein